jgi:hypothetical protein
MTLSPGTRLGPYEIQSAIGAGGMGEQPFDARTRRVSGEAFVVADSVSSNYVSGLAAFSVSSDGVVEYTPSPEPVQLMWLNADGGVQEMGAKALSSSQQRQQRLTDGGWCQRKRRSLGRPRHACRTGRALSRGNVAAGHAQSDDRCHRELAAARG